MVDISLPDGNGFTVFTKIKEMQDIPVIFLTASADETGVATGLNMGADDYVTKPFRPRELVARINAALRKSGQSKSTFEVGGLHIDSASSIVKKNNSEIFLLWYEDVVVRGSNRRNRLMADLERVRLRRSRY